MSASNIAKPGTCCCIFLAYIVRAIFSFPVPCEIACTLDKSLGQKTLFCIDSEGLWILELTFPKFDAVSLNWCCFNHSADSPCNTVLCSKELDSLLSITMWSLKKEVRSGWCKMFSSVKSKDVLLSIPTGRSINSEHYTATLSATKLPLVRLLTNPVLGRPWSCNWYPKQVPSVTFPNTVFCRKDCVWSLNKLENGGEFSFCVRKSTCSITWHFGRPFLMAGLLASYSLHLTGSLFLSPSRSVSAPA